MRIVDCNGINTHADFSKVRCYTGLQGKIMSLFGKAIATQKQNQTVFINKNSLVKNLCDAKNDQITLKKLQSSSLIHQRVIEILNPIVGQKIRFEEVNVLFQKLRMVESLKNLSEASTREDFFDLLDKTFDQIKLENTDLPVHAYDASELEKVLQPGDILFRKIPDDMDNSIVTGQRIQQFFYGGKYERESYKFSHAAMYLGDGWIGEAAWPTGKEDEIRALKLSDPRFALAEGEKRQYWIFRPNDASLGAEAAAKAKEIVKQLQHEDGVDPEDQKTPFRYTIFEGARSLYHTSWFGPFGKMRYLQQYIDDKEGNVPTNFRKVENFFCSYLVGYCYQVAEARRIVPGILGADDVPAKGSSSLKNAFRREIWSRMRRWSHLGELNKHVEMRYDAKRTSPQALRHFMHTHPKLFTQVGIITA